MNENLAESIDCARNLDVADGAGGCCNRIAHTHYANHRPARRRHNEQRPLWNTLACAGRELGNESDIAVVIDSDRADLWAISLAAAKWRYVRGVQHRMEGGSVVSQEGRMSRVAVQAIVSRKNNMSGRIYAAAVGKKDHLAPGDSRDSIAYLDDPHS